MTDSRPQVVRPHMKRDTKQRPVIPTGSNPFEGCADLIDIGAGLFLYSDAEGSFALGDSCDVEPDRWFGPAAWRGERGPAACRCLLEVEAVHRGRWDQTGADQWRWTSEDGVEHGEPVCWPARIRVMEGAGSALFDHLNGAIVGSAEVLIELLRAFSAKRAPRALRTASAAERLAALSRAWPTGGDPSRHAMTH